MFLSNVIHLSKFSALMGLLFFERGCFLELTSLKVKSLYPDLRLSKSDLCLYAALGGNAKGDYKRNPVMVYHSVNPCALKGYVKHLVPLNFYSNAKGQVTRPLSLTTKYQNLKMNCENIVQKKICPLKFLLLLTVHLVIQQQFRIFMSTYKWRLSL
jgi:hypothetical protein